MSEFVSVNMSRGKKSAGELQELRVDVLAEKRRHSHSPAVMMGSGRGTAKVSSRSTDFVYMNGGYVASVSDVRQAEEGRRRVVPVEPPTSVIREQYWTCSKWSFGQRFLAVAVAVLFGTVVGLAAVVILANADSPSTRFFR